MLDKNWPNCEGIKMCTKKKMQEKLPEWCGKKLTQIPSKNCTHQTFIKVKE